MRKERRSDNGLILDLGNGMVRVYVQTIEMTDEQNNVSYESEYIDVEDTSYDTLVHELIRDKYSQSAEFALLRQREAKSAEFAAYDEYCEACKLKAKEICASLAI